MFPGYPTLAIPNPRGADFAALMELYESNYLRLRSLCPDLHAFEGEQVSRVSHGSDLHLRVLERTRYTTRLYLTYEFERGGRIVRQPGLTIRVFHDARQAEVIGRFCRRRGEDITVDAIQGVPGLACRWRQNRFLYKWLGFCLRQGHRFGAVPLNAGRPMLDPLV